MKDGLVHLFVPLSAYYLVLLRHLSLPRIPFLCRHYWIFESYYGKQRVEHLEDGYRWEQILGMTAWRRDGGVQMLGAVPNADS